VTGLPDQLASNRAARSAARGAFDAKLAQVQADLAARGIGGRVADMASTEIKDALGEAAAIARESKGIIAATGAALALWLLRAPLIAFAGRRLASRRKTADVQAD
jgi:hypothetical protein